MLMEKRIIVLKYIVYEQLLIICIFDQYYFVMNSDNFEYWKRKFRGENKM